MGNESNREWPPSDVRRVFQFEDGVWEFQVFLDTLWRDLLEEDQPPAGLMEAVAAWMEHGNGFRVCRQYDDFLKVTLRLTRAWAEEDRISVGGCPLWPFAIGMSVPFATKERRHLLLAMAGDPHPLLNREVFAQLKTHVLLGGYETN